VPDETPSGEPLQPASDDSKEATTPGGYSYTVVDGDSAAPVRAGGSNPLLLIVAAIVPAAIVGAAVWFFASGGGGSSSVSGNVSNVVTAFSQGATGTVSTTYEGKLPPGYPEGVPQYPGAKVVSSVLETRGSDVAYLIVFDAGDSRAKVAAYYGEQFNKDPWQIDGGQDTAESTFHQFSKIDDDNVAGLIIVGESKESNVTTIVESLQITAGAKNTGKATFTPDEGRTMPDGFPGAVPVYDGASIFESAYQKQASGNAYAVSFLTKDSSDDVLKFYRTKLGDSSLTVADGDASNSSLADASALTFSDASSALSGMVTVGKFAQDESYTRIDVQVQSTKAGASVPGGSSASTPVAGVTVVVATPEAVATP
jgi:hypothetical protein